MCGAGCHLLGNGRDGDDGGVVTLSVGSWQRGKLEAWEDEGGWVLGEGASVVGGIGYGSGIW